MEVRGKRVHRDDLVLAGSDEAGERRAELLVVAEPRAAGAHVTGDAKAGPVVELLVDEGARGVRHGAEGVADEVDVVRTLEREGETGAE